MRALLRARPGVREGDDRTPLRAELFSADQMERHGQALAHAHTLSRARTSERLLRRLDENERTLAETCGLLTTALKAKSRLVPAGVWLVDNFPLIDEQIRTARKHLPKGYSREIPRLAEGPSRGLPRVYDLALEAIAHGDGRVDADSLVRFVAAYQTVTPLTLGELWAIPIMLRLALIENLSRVGMRILDDRVHRERAADWANRMMEIARTDPKALILVIGDMARSDPPLVGPFVAELARRLQGHGRALALPLTWIEQQLAESSLTIAQLVWSENQQQAADQVSIGNTIGSLRFLDATDWHTFVETVSLVEQVLRQDGTGQADDYRHMDFATRDGYRHAIAAIARRSPRSELEVARAAIAIASAAKENAPEAHVGYYLVDRGRPRLEAEVRFRPSIVQRIRRVARRHAMTLYVGSILLMTLAFAAGLSTLVDRRVFESTGFALLAVAILLGASQLATALVNWFSTLLTRPRRVPRMDYSRGIPAQGSTLVVVPTLLSSTAQVAELLEALEVRFLGNVDDHVRFGLLSDFRDASEEELETDEPLLLKARSGIESLNRKYPSASGRFFLFHRPRRWNAADRVWMGYERKRGKLEELNAALRGAGFGRFSLVVGGIEALSDVRYVITLDTDTLLPRDSARQMVGAMSHPLNRPQYDAAGQRVISGYGILQPRVNPSLSGAGLSRYARMWSGEPGIDPYTRSASDVYQDVFDEGSFVGKGIYDVDAFERVLAGRLPDNRVLSHDLLEGAYVRSGLLSDVPLYEEHPARYSVDVTRQRRWIRGDWQIARWLLPNVPGPAGTRRTNPLSALSRWKILDNLRRCLVAPALLVLLLPIWAGPSRTIAWTMAVIGILLIPPTLAALLDAVRKDRARRWGQHFGAMVRAAGRSFAQAGFRIACLPYEAAFSLGAVIRTNWRMAVTRRGLLEWNVAMHRDAGGSLLESYRTMWTAPAAAVVFLAAALLQGTSREALAISPLFGLWLLAPGIAWWLSLPLRHREELLTPDQTLFLRRIARKTWAYFERFVTAEEHWLPPDNFQETPEPVVAHRTSPTNIGLALLANLAAADFGYITGGTFLSRTANTFGTLSRLARHRGHFFNWYDTRTLEVLPPRYVSAVDSGNFAGHLLTLRSALEAFPEQAVVSPRLLEGLLDTLANVGTHASAALEDTIRGLREQLKTPPGAHAAPSDSLDVLRRFAASCDRLGERDPGANEEFRMWADALERQVRDAMGDLEHLMPWLSSPSSDTGLARFTDVGSHPTLRDLVERTDVLRSRVDAQILEAGAGERVGLQQLRLQLVAGHERARERVAQCARLADEAGGFATLEFEFLYDRTRRLLAIGHDVDAARTDTGCYDLLASEARLCIFVAIAQGLLPQESWFALGRQMSAGSGRPVLSSWSGSMFEYLMPLLVMPSYENTLLDQTCREVVALQIEYGDRSAVPWGISESGYSSVDASSNYQYHAFGVPGIGLQRGLGNDTVIAPYASALALMVAPGAACTNLQRLSSEGVEGRYGFYEAVDYSPSRLSRGQSRVVVRSFMAHHQGMSLLSLCHRLLRQPMQRRFETVPMFQATLPLLHERIPLASVFDTGAIASAGSGDALDTASSTTTLGADTPHPEVQLMSNGRYHVMVTNAGGGYSRWKDLAITRWHEDTTCDGWGTFLYLRDVGSGAFWSSARQPVPMAAERYEVTFSEGRAEIRRRDHEWEVHSEIVVSPEDDIELRRLHLTNLARVPRSIEVTSYAEVVLAPPGADAVQPAFGNLFVQTEVMSTRRAIVCTRRPRSVTDAEPWMFHLLAAEGRRVQDVSYETDRVRFIGRGGGLDRPQALTTSAPLSGSEGSVLDPIVSIRCRLTLDPGESTTLDWITGAADSREACLALVDKYQDRHRADRVLDLAWTHAGVALRQINATEADAQLYRRLAGPVLYATPTFRASAGVLERNQRGQAGLWAYSISGDLPIVLLRIASIDHLDLARRMIQCHTYWRLKGLAVDLVIWNEDHADYRQLLHRQIMALIADGIESPALDRPGGIFVRSTEQISDEDRTLLQSVARVVIGDARRPSLEMADRGVVDVRAPRLARTRVERFDESTVAAPAKKSLLHDNGIGGFSADGCEYVITTTPTRRTPAPWVNVIANSAFGTIVSESGPGYTWHENAHEFRLTPWNADAVSTASGEAFYLRDEESGHFWSPTPAPRGGEAEYRTRHGFGYSVFEHTSLGIQSELWIYVDLKEAVKFSVLKIRNRSRRTRRLSATGYVEWVLGELRPRSAMHVVTEIDPTSGALFARNAFNAEFGQRVAFFDVDDLSRTLSGDRTEFLGRNGSLHAPDAMTAARLSGRLGAGLDPCGAIQVPFDLADGQEREIIFRLGAGTSLENARDLARRLRRAGSARAALENVRQYWTATLGAVQVRTPDPALNVLANGWLVYQTLACRMWARSGHYQSGGAFGFRDQLQDAMAMVHTEPRLVREHLLRCAEHQYAEGDVQHWWHPPAGRGVRTRCSDDYLWLPLAVCRYVMSTGDVEVLAQEVPFLEGRPLRDEEESHYDLPGRSARRASLYEHCRRAIVHGLRYGEHGLPLMGSGDWNDGMNLVGIHGRGESVWLGFFLYQVLLAFEPVARRQDDAAFAKRCEVEAQRLRHNLEQHAWDGAWYRRAWFDDGSLLGSSVSAECSIDSISQSWSVLSGAGDPSRGRAAMEAVDLRLVRRDLGLVQLLDPPFDRSSMNPGYIRGYVPGVRENGGQYTHAAIWAAMAFAQLGDRERAWELLGLINPLNHARDASAVAIYKVEPYVVAADVYARAPHGGRGGWTWYTGSAGWLYRLILESLLGLRVEADRLFFRPCVPSDWTGFEIDYRYRATIYRIRIRRVDAAADAGLTLDGAVQRDLAIDLVDDGQAHVAEITYQPACA